MEKFPKMTSRFAHVLTGFLVILFLASPVLAHAGEGPRHHMMMHGGPVGFLLLHQDDLGLNHEQVVKLSRIKMDFFKIMIMERARIKVLKLQNMMLMMHRGFDTAKARENNEQILSHKKKIMDGCVRMLSEAGKTLTPEQFEKAKKLMRQMIVMHHEMMMHQAMMSHS